MKTDIEGCTDPNHPTGVDHLDYHLTLGQSLPTPDRKFECWLHPVLPDGTSVRHRWDDRRHYDCLILMRTLRAEAEGNIEARWNRLTKRQRQAFMTAAVGDAYVDPRFLEDFDSATLKLPARKPNNPVFE